MSMPVKLLSRGSRLQARAYIYTTFSGQMRSAVYVSDGFLPHTQFSSLTHLYVDIPTWGASGQIAALQGCRSET